MPKANTNPTTSTPPDPSLGAPACAYLQMSLALVSDHIDCVELVAGQAADKLADEDVRLERGLLAAVRGLSGCFEELKSNFASMQREAPWNPNVKVAAEEEA